MTCIGFFDKHFIKNSPCMPICNCRAAPVFDWLPRVVICIVGQYHPPIIKRLHMLSIGEITKMNLSHSGERSGGFVGEKKIG